MIPGSLLRDTADVSRYAQTRNSMGATVNTLAAAHLTNEPCRLDYLRESREISDRTTAPAGSPLVFISPDADIQIGDIMEVTTRNGEKITIVVTSAPPPLSGFGLSHREIIGSLRQ